MVTGSTRASHCVTQPIYARLVMGFRLRHQNIPSDFQKVYFKFPEFSRIKKSLSFQSCKHPVQSVVIRFNVLDASCMMYSVVDF